MAAFRRRAWLVLRFEAAWRALAPPLGLLGAYAALGLLGLPAFLGGSATAMLLAATLAGAAWLALRRPAIWRAPAPAEIDRRLERDAGLAHHPLAALADRPAGTDPASLAPITLALWDAHRARAEAALARLRTPRPHPHRAAADRFGLGGGLIVALAAALAIAGPRASSRLDAAFLPRPGGAMAPPARIAAWITPPAYTGLAPVALSASAPALTVPAGSRLHLGISGGSGRVRARFGGTALTLAPLGRDGVEANAVLARSGRLAVSRGGTALGAWRIAVVPAVAPRLAWAAPPGPLAADPRETALPWRAHDAYGLTRLGIVLVPRDRPGAKPRRIALTPPSPPRTPPVPGGPGVAQHGVAIRDLTADPWAGLVVTARLEGGNGAGLAGTSAPAMFQLPERHFRDTLARAVLAVRRFLSLHPDRGAAAARALAALRDPPRGFGTDFGAWLELGIDIGRLAAPARIAAVQQSLWRVAVGLEDRARD
ncbi:MAG: DUF4175 family protein, partial [Rhodospirillales bacterium]|nr:DUF4175 family protein [Rhodospirillales bacterium]